MMTKEDIKTLRSIVSEAARVLGEERMELEMTMSNEDREKLTKLLKEELAWTNPVEEVLPQVKVNLSTMTKRFNKEIIQSNLKKAAQHFGGSIVLNKTVNSFAATFPTIDAAQSFADYIKDKVGIEKHARIKVSTTAKKDVKYATVEPTLPLAPVGGSPLDQTSDLDPSIPVNDL